ncbi:hypothetical protein BH11PLA2_BH11PLA2_08580 [soil metagenome]
MPRFILFLLACSTATAGEPVTTTIDPATVPAMYRLAPATFDVTVTKKYDLIHSNVEVYDVTFPSAVKSPYPENNIVYAELFRPKTAAKTPTVIIFDILDGATVVSRGQAMWLAQHNITAMAFTMAYYGPRRPAGTKMRMIMPDIEHSVTAVQQTVLDARRAIQYLATRPDVDTAHLGVVGTSLGSFIGGLVAASEPKITHATLMLGGGDLVNAFYDHPKAKTFRAVNDLLGFGKGQLHKMIDPVDPITYAEQLKTKKLMLIAASRDDVVPPIAMKKLWEATDRPSILWLNATHVGAAAYIFPMMTSVIESINK